MIGIAIGSALGRIASGAPIVPPENRRVPEGVEFVCDDWLWVKSYTVKAGEMIAQHRHEFDHVTVVATGTVRLWIDDQDQGEITGPKPVTVRALAEHKLLAVTDAVLICVHNLRGKGEPGVIEEG